MITISAFADEIGPDLTQQMDVCEAHGVHCIDVRSIDGKNISSMSLEEAREYRARMQDRGFSVPCLGSPLGKIRMDEDFNAHLELLKHTCDLAAVFGTRLIRVFSFYPSQGANIVDEREGVLERLAAMLRVAEAADCVLMHENESRIYGDVPERVKDIFASLPSNHLQGIFDPSNFVTDGVKPYDEGWSAGLDKVTHFFHIKDKVTGQRTSVPAGDGDGQIEELCRDLKRRNWSGFMTLEPHILAEGDLKDASGAERFGMAARGLQNLLDRVGLPYQ